MTIRLRESTNEKPVFFVPHLSEISTEICSRCPIGSTELQTLLRVSQHLRAIVYDIYKKNVEDILKRHANNDTSLNHIIFNISAQPDVNPLISFETISEIQQSIIQQIKTSGIPCPNKHLGLEDMARFNQALEDLNLQKIWVFISQALAVGGKPAENASAQEIRLWMHQNKNHLQEIVQLDLSDKALTAIPQEITLLTELQRLGLYKNQITTLPQGLFDQLNQLQLLDLSNNQISALPRDLFDRLHQLQVLDLSNNQISALPQGLFDQLNQLQALGLSNNQISALPQDTFDQLNQLQVLGFYNNQISALPQGLFDQLNQLQLLDLSNNQISALPQDIFDQLNLLKQLALHNNQISALPQGLFDQLNQLQLLDMSNNQISALPQGLFNRLHQLQELGLHNNQITTLPRGLFDQLHQLQHLYLYGNPRLLFFYKDMQTSVLRTPNLALNKDLIAFKEFSAYVCMSSFAKFYKSVAQENSLNNEMESLSHLSPFLQKVIGTKIQEEQDNSLPLALKKAVRWIFETRSDELKNLIYTLILQLAQESDAFKRQQNPALPPEDFTDPNWGQNHAQDNILRLIDAMSLSIVGFES